MSTKNKLLRTPSFWEARRIFMENSPPLSPSPHPKRITGAQIPGSLSDKVAEGEKLEKIKQEIVNQSYTIQLHDPTSHLRERNSVLKKIGRFPPGTRVQMTGKTHITQDDSGGQRRDHIWFEVRSEETPAKTSWVSGEYLVPTPPDVAERAKSALCKTKKGESGKLNINDAAYTFGNSTDQEVWITQDPKSDFLNVWTNCPNGNQQLLVTLNSKNFADKPIFSAEITTQHLIAFREKTNTITLIDTGIPLQEKQTS